MNIGVALVPDEKFIERFVSLQERARFFLNLSPILGTDRNLPHLTLIQGNFADRINYQDLLASLYDFVKAKSSPVIVSTQRFVYVENGWYFLTVEKTPQLQALHDHVFELSKEYLIAPAPGSQDLQYYSPLERENYLRYGYRFIGEAFSPHFTLGRYLGGRRDQAEAMLNHLMNELGLAQQVPIDRLTVYLMGEHGAHQETLHRVGLGNS